jgi:hypothetical protein
MKIISRSFGPDQVHGIELELFSALDEIDMAINTWEIVAAKLAIKLFGLEVILASLEISDTRATLCCLNCFLTVFWE